MRCLLLVGLVAATLFAAAAAEPARPSILLILADDLGWGSAGCYGADSNLIRTPHIDRLAREGRRFTDANTPSSVCSPTRYAVLTGRYCWRTSLSHQVLGVYSPLHLETNRPTLASLLKPHGYRTAAIGKWHLGYGAERRTDYTRELNPGPLEVGFDYHFGVPANHGDVTGVFVEDHRVAGLRSATLTPTPGTNFRGNRFIGLDAPPRDDPDVMPTLTRKAAAWLAQQQKGKPFFLYYTPVAVHNPITPSPTTRGTSRAGAFGDFIHELDQSVGALLDILDRKELANETLVIFTSDNGGVNRSQPETPQAHAMRAGLKPCGPFRGGKHDVWEGGFRVPFVARWPGRIPAGTVCREMISLTDLFATLAALLGQPMPSTDKAAEDSHNILPALLGREHASPLRPDMIVHSADGNFALRQGRWKYIEGKPARGVKPGALRARADQMKPQLYDLAADPAESRDVISAQSELADRLQTLLNRYRDQGHSRQ